MRTTITIDDDVLLAAKTLARRDGVVISELARKGLNADPSVDAAARERGLLRIRPLPRRGKPVTNELIDRLRDDGPH